MRIKTLFAVLVKASVWASLFFIFSASSIMAQKDKEQTATPEKALEMLRKYEIPVAFYDKLQAQETGWQLIRFFPPQPIDNPKNTFVLHFRKGDNQAGVYIYEYETAAKAAEFSILNIHISSGRVEEYNRYGDEGKKIYGNRGFSSLSYRKNRFVVSIYCDDEKTAERFAGYFSDAVNF